MLTLFKDTKTNKIIARTYKFESIVNALDKKYQIKKKRYIALKQIVELNEGVIIQTINLLAFPGER